MENKVYLRKDVENEWKKNHVSAWYERILSPARKIAERQRFRVSWLTKKSRHEYKVKWQQESPAKEYLEQAKCCHDKDCNESMMKKASPP